MTAICPFKAMPKEPAEWICEDCGAARDESCRLVKVAPAFDGAPITAGTAEVCDDGDVCEACQ